MEGSPALSIADLADLPPITGQVWLAYDQAFRKQAAATNLADWSTLTVQLFNFHAAGALVRGHDAVTELSKPRGTASSTVICRSWN